MECEAWGDDIHEAHSAVLLEGPAVPLVHGLKYEGWTRAAEVMAARMAPLLPPGAPAAPPLLVPVPTTPQRHRIRGYNQTEVIAVNLQRISGLEVCRGLERRATARSQVRLGRALRQRNVATAFAVRPEARRRLHGRSVVVVDDVLTTGATATAVGRALATVGVQRTSVLTFARTVPLSARVGSA